MFEIALAIFLGLLAGTFTGLFPGIHINLISSIILSSYFVKLHSNIPNEYFATFIISMAITHTFIDFIPSIYLGAPEEDSFLAILPGHKMLIEGRGSEAYVLTAIGSFLGAIVLVPIIFILNYSFETIYILSKNLIPYILIFLSGYLIFREKYFISGLTIFVFSGFLGIFSTNLPIPNALMPLFSGLFGLSTLITSIKNKTKIPLQKKLDLKKIDLKKISISKNLLISSIISPLASFLPGFGSSQAAIISSEISGKETNQESFLFLLGTINTIVMGISFITLISLNKTRTGAAIALQRLDIISNFNSPITEVLLIILITSFFAFILGIFISNNISKIITKISYSNITIVTIIIIIILNCLLTNYVGILLLIASTALGIFCISSDVKRTLLMGSLITPTIIFYLT